MKIANIIEEGRLGGPQIRIAEVAKFLYPRGYETTVILPTKESRSFFDRLQAYGIPGIRVPLQRPSKDLMLLVKYLLFLPRDIAKLYKLLRRNHFDVVHVSGGAWQCKGAIAGKLAGCRVVWHLNDTKTPWIVKKCFSALTKRLADCFIVAGQKVSKYYFESPKELNGKAIFEIQAPVDCGHFDPSKVNHSPYINKFEGIKILSVGNINPIKGFEYLLTAAGLLTNLSYLVNFFVVGSHLTSQIPYYEKLENLKKKLGLKNVHFLGTVNDVRPLIKSANIYVCTSLAEASPISIWEAMSMGKAIVSTDVGDVSCFIKDSENGFIVPAKNPEALAEKIAMIIDNINLQNLFGEKSRIVAQKCLDIHITVRNHMRAYNHLMRTGN